MEILNTVDMQFIWGCGAFLVFCALYYSINSKQKRGFLKVEESVKRQEQANYQLGLILNELRRSNRLLGELANIEIEEVDQSMGQDAAGASSYQNQNPQANADGQYKLYVGNIDYTATEAELGAYFGQHGKVEFVNIPVNRYTGKARGFGFVSFPSKEDAERAMTLHGSEFKGRQIQVNFAKERELA